MGLDLVGEGMRKGKKVREWEGMGGKGLLNFHLIFKETWAEPGNPR